MTGDNNRLENVNCNLCGKDDYTVRYKKDGYNIVQCNNCGLVYVNPRLKKEEIEKLYNEDYFLGRGFDKSVEYRKEFLDSANVENLLDWDVSSIKEYMKTGSESPKMLDAGCGMGLFLFKAKQSGFEVKGLELSEYAAGFAREQELDVTSHSIEETDIGENKYDAIVMREVIEHLRDPKAALQKIHRALKKGGVLFITTGNYNSPERKVKGSDWSYFMPEGHLYIFSNRTMKKYLEDTGFDTIKVTNQGDMLMNALLGKGIIEADKFKPKSLSKRAAFESIRSINHFISSGMRVYARK